MRPSPAPRWSPGTPLPPPPPSCPPTSKLAVRPGGFRTGRPAPHPPMAGEGRPWLTPGAGVVRGGRAPAPAPVPDPAAAAVLDDGPEALKEERPPPGHARARAAERARRRGARLTVVSPVPPLEAPGPVLAPARTAERAGWPITEVVDRRREPPGLGPLPPPVVAALRAAAGAGAPPRPGGRARCV